MAAPALPLGASPSGTAMPGGAAAVKKPVSSPRELTLRALTMGCLIGAVLAAGNVYTGLKTSFVDGGSITAALLGFMFFATFKRFGRSPFSALETNITQTTAASAAIMGVYPIIVNATWLKTHEGRARKRGGVSRPPFCDDAPDSARASRGVRNDAGLYLVSIVIVPFLIVWICE